MKTSNEMNAVDVRGLAKSYGSVRALQNVTLQVRQGEIFGFLGPNGAGKTTTIRCLLDLIRPDSGTIRLMGADPQADPVRVRQQTGYLPGEPALFDNLTAEQQLKYFNDLRGRPADWARVRRLADRLDLKLSRQIKNLSKGNKQKVAIIQALMHQPALLLLDEPTSGLDPLMQQEVLALIREAQAAGATVFFSSHIMSEVEEVAERVGIIRQGSIVETAETASLTRRAMRHVIVKFKEPVDSEPLARLPGVKILSRKNGVGATLQIEGEMDRFIKELGTFPVADLETSQPSLEEAFLNYYVS